MTCLQGIIVLGLLCFTGPDAVNYCEKNICGGSKVHTLCKIRHRLSHRLKTDKAIKHDIAMRLPTSYATAVDKLVALYKAAAIQFSGPSPNCIYYEQTITSEKNKQQLLDKINWRRNKVASGEIRSLPAADSMIKLEWNDELALSAQRWADQCETHGVEDSCRDVENATVGQNIATIKGESPGLSPHVLVDLWYIELLNINSSILSSYQSSSSIGCQHYDYFTQLVWGTTTAVGCGGVKFTENEDESSNREKTVYRLVCNFALSGNHQGMEVYSAGKPCSKCPESYSCDSELTSLCSKDLDDTENIALSLETNKLNAEYSSPVMEKIVIDTDTNESEINSSDIGPIELKIPEVDSADSFDLLSHLFETSTASTETTPITPRCKDVIAVEEFIRMLKHKLNTEQLVRDFLSTNTSSSDITPSDENVKAVVQQIYSKKIPSTTTSATESDHMNSTLLANMVEAIIFRKSDAISTTHNPYTDTPTYNNIKPIKIQASLGEVKVNNEFSGHLFFPEEGEDEEKSESESTEYYDSTDIPASDIGFEIENISRNTRTRNFLDEILEEELLKEGATEDSPISTYKEFDMVNKITNSGTYARNYRRFKRRNKNNTYSYVIERKAGGEYIHYFDLLRKLAEDLRQLKLREKYYCPSNNACLIMTHSHDNIACKVTCIIMINTFYSIFY